LEANRLIHHMKRKQTVDTPYKGSYADIMARAKNQQANPQDPALVPVAMQHLQRIRNIQIRLESMFGRGGWTPQEVELATKKEYKEFPDQHVSIPIV
jgi:hypothetical protein